MGDILWRRKDDGFNMEIDDSIVDETLYLQLSESSY